MTRNYTKLGQSITKSKRDHNRKRHAAAKAKRSRRIKQEEGKR